MERLIRGLLAGAAGTAAMTAYQEALSGNGGSQERSWEDAPAPAKVARKALRLVGVDPGAKRIPLLTNLMHWGYGTAWGGVYGLVRRGNPVLAGLLFGTGVWAASYAQLVPLGLYEPPWEYPAPTVAKDLSYHLVYGVGVATAFETLD